MVGQIGRYRIEEEIGRGGMAVVYRAQDIELERYVALKLLAAHLEKKELVMERFAQEARIIASLEHPHIVPIYDYDVFEIRPYLVMRLLPGGTFRERMGNDVLTMDVIWPLSMQIAAALDDAHDHGVIHRDIKPSNILFDQTGSVYVSDFGVAKMAGSTTRITKRQQILGTPAYMSPEQCTESETDGRSDQYSLAVVLFEALGGSRPFTGDTLQLMYKHTHELPPMVHELNESLPPALSVVLGRALSKKPEERYPTITAFVTSLQQASLTAEPQPPGQVRPVVLADGTTYSEPLNADYAAGKEALDRGNWRVAIRYFSRVGPNDPYYGRAIRYKRDARGQIQKAKPQLTSKSTEAAKTTKSKDEGKNGRKRVDAGSKKALSSNETPKKKGWMDTLRQISIALVVFIAILALAVFIVVGLGSGIGGGKGKEPSPTASVMQPSAIPELQEKPELEVIEENEPPLEIAPPLFAETIGSGARWRNGQESEAITPGERVPITLSQDQLLSISAGQGPLTIELPSGEKLFLDGQTEVVFQTISSAFGAEKTSIVINEGRLVADSGDHPLLIANRFGANIHSTGSLIGVMVSTSPLRFHAACLDADSCEVTGEDGESDHVIMQGGQYSEVGGQGIARAPKPARVELFSDLSDRVLTATATAEPTPTLTPTLTPTATSRPRLPTLTPTLRPTAIPTATPVGDLDRDGVPDDIDLCPGQYGPGDRNGCPRDRD